MYWNKRVSLYLPDDVREAAKDWQKRTEAGFCLWAGWKNACDATGGMSQRDISEQIKELYGVEISPELVTKISEKSRRK